MIFPGVVLEIFTEFISLTLKVTPYFLLGVLFGALLKTYLKPDFAFRYLRQGSSSVINASILGAILPGCACATIPMAEGLKEKGARLGTVAAFIMVSPLLSPQTVILTYAMLGWKFTAARIFFSMTGAIFIGLILNYLKKIKARGFISVEEPQNAAFETAARASSECDEKKSGFWKTAFDIAKDLSRYFLLGMFIASLLTALIPEEAISKYIGSSGAFAYAVAVLIGIPVYICEGEEIPITLALLKLGLGSGPAFSFLLGSVGTCIPTMIMAQRVIGRRAVFYYLAYWFLFAIASGLLFSLF